MRRKYTDEEIENGLDLLAELIDRYGEIYWTIFERLERELSARQDKASKLRARLLPRAASTEALPINIRAKTNQPSYTKTASR